MKFHCQIFLLLSVFVFSFEQSKGNESLDLSVLTHNHVNDLVQGKHAFWFATDSGINRGSIEQTRIKEVTFRRTSKPVLSMADHDSYLVVGIASKGLYLFDKKTYLFRGLHKKTLGKSDIVSISKVQKGFLLSTNQKKNYLLNLEDSILSPSDLKPGASDDREYRVGERVLELVNGKLYWKSETANDPTEVKQQEQETPIEEKSGESDVAEGEIQGKLDGQVLQQMIAIEQDAEEVEAKDRSSISDHSSCSSGSLSFWYGFLLMLLISIVVIIYLYRKMKKDIKVLEDEILKNVGKH